MQLIIVETDDNVEEEAFKGTNGPTPGTATT